MKWIIAVGSVLLVACYVGFISVWMSQDQSAVEAAADNANGEVVRSPISAEASAELERIHGEIVDQLRRANPEVTDCPSDRAACEELRPVYQKWLDTYETDPGGALEAYNECCERVRDILVNKPIVGLRYNEFVGREVEVPIYFGLFKEGDRFYFRIGDGDFSTVTPMTVRELYDFHMALEKVGKWKQQCRRTRMNARKPVGRFGGMSLEFISKEEGDNIYVWLTAVGPWGRDRMVEEQTVRLTPLNITAMYYDIGRCQELVDSWEEEQRNAQRLR